MTRWLAATTRTLREAFSPSEVLPSSFRRLLETVLWFRLGLAALAMPIVPFLPATTQKRWLFVGMAFFVWIPWAIALMLIGRRAKRVRLVAPMTGDLLVVFVFHLLVPELGPVIFYGYTLALAFYAYVGGRVVGLTVGILVTILLIVGRALSPEAVRMDWFSTGTFTGVMISITLLLDRASREERAAIAELRRLDEAKSEFIANAAHELRTPMSTLAGVAQTVSRNRERLTDEQVDELLAALGRQADRSQRLINNLLDLSRMRAGRLTLDLELLDLQSIVAAVLEAAPPPDPVTVENRIPSGIEVLVDRTHFERVLVNLLTNAYRYGGANVVVACARTEGNLNVVVADDGGGIPQEILPRLFEPFVRGPEAARAMGSGLGLSITRHLVEALGGALRYEPGDPGARFIVELKDNG